MKRIEVAVGESCVCYGDCIGFPYHIGLYKIMFGSMSDGEEFICEFVSGVVKQCRFIGVGRIRKTDGGICGCKYYIIETV